MPDDEDDERFDPAWGFSTIQYRAASYLLQIDLHDLSNFRTRSNHRLGACASSEARMPYMGHPAC